MKIASPYMAITWHHCQRRINKTMPEECTLPEVKFTFAGFVPNHSHFLWNISRKI